MVNCPVCDAVLDAEEDELDEGDEITCEECGAGLEVVSTDPLEIQSVGSGDDDEDEEEDDDVDDDEDEEEEEDDEDEEWR